ncbi:ABC transporter permease subunit [Thermomonas flagellata]|uniref:ABC transporter permease subunit n=1 Tax=Thermomonas flagellata TaxID=2888524 RepID=UPI001F0404A2|nr:ABC transporter permease subunit [Thermomonas flagellata]
MNASSARWGNRLVLLLGFAFLYAPILSLVVYSFNESRLVTVWSGFSTKWYGELLADREILDAAWMSLRLAVFTATAALVLGTLAAMLLTRFRRFPGKTLFGALVTAPLVMPDVIIGLSLLLLFVTLGELLGTPIPRGMLTIWIAQTTFSVAFVSVTVASRLSALDRSLEEAAMDLGATRVKVFFQITLPIVAPALLAGWLLAFTLSLDDLVVASFVAGPSSTTLPMKVFSSVRLGVSPKINALATLLILAVSAAAVVGWWLMAREERRRRRDVALAAQRG